MSRTPAEIRALITLLGDDDRNIRDIARDELLRTGEAADTLLEQVAFSDAEGRIRIEAQAILEENRLQHLNRAFGRLNQTRDFDLEEASFLLAQVEYPNLDVSAYTGRIDELAFGVEKKIQAVRDEKRRVEAINQFLFVEQGFHGNRKAYYDAQNSFINQVLDRRRGIPISLSAIYLFIARRLRLPVCGIGFPCHFLLKYRRGSPSFFIDPFNRGQILSRQDCEQFLNKMGCAARNLYFAQSEPKEIFARMIRNLVLIYQQENKLKKIANLERVFHQLVVK